MHYEPQPAKLDDQEVLYLRNRILQLQDEKSRLRMRLKANEDDLKLVTDRLSKLLGFTENTPNA